MRRALLLALALPAAAGCLHRTPADVQREQARTLRPSALDSSPVAVADPTLPRRVFRVRAWADADYRAQVLRWQSQIPAQLERAAAILETQLGIRLELVAVRAWDHASRSGDHTRAVRELAAHDPGDDVDWVVGFVSSLDELSALHEQLGAAVLGGRHLVLRGMASFAEADAVRRHFDKLPERELDDLLRERQRHKEVAVLLHEWAHTLGVDHDASTRWLMAPGYEPGQSAFSPESLALLVEGLRRRAAPGAGGLPPPAAPVPAPVASDAPAGPALPADEVALLREAAAHEQAGRIEAAWKLLAPLAARRLEEVRLQEAACLLSARRAPRDAATLDTCRRAAGMEGVSARGLLVLAELLARGGKGAEAQRALARAEAVAARTGPGELWPQMAALYDRLGNCTGAERVAARAGARAPPELLADCARLRREVALPRGTHSVPEEREREYVGLVQAAAAQIGRKRPEEARATRQKLASLFPGAPGGALVECLLAGAASDPRLTASACGAAVALAPEAARAHYLLGRAAAQERRWGEAHGHLRRALELDDKAGDVWSLLATACEQAGRGDELADLRARYLERYGWELRADPPPQTGPGGR